MRVAAPIIVAQGGSLTDWVVALALILILCRAVIAWGNWRNRRENHKRNQELYRE